MTTRGLKYNFSVGEHVLCFEPDPTKARVLYQAKVLELSPGKDKVGRRKPEYHIHFQGWNNSWDRIVGEDFILKNSEENKVLMKRLAETARKFATNYSRKNKARKQKIDALLKAAYVKKPEFESGSESDSGSDNSSEDDGSDEENTEDSSLTQDALQNGTDKEDQNSNISVSDSDSDDEVSIKGKNVHHHVELPIPKVLKECLETDYYNINKEGKLLKLPAEPNVISFLEGYVKHFVMNILFNNTEKLRPGLREFTRPEPEKSVPLCKEVMQGLRVCFDFTLPTLLLYNGEKKQLAELTANFKPPITGPPIIKKEVESPEIEEPMSPMTSSRLRSSERIQSCSGSEPSPKIPKLSKEEKCEEPPRRRLTRLSVSEVSRRSLDNQPLILPRVNRKSRTRASTEHTVTRTTRRHSQGTNSVAPDDPSTDLVESVAGSNSTCKNSQSAYPLSGLSQRVTPPPPLLIPNTLSSQSSSPHLTPTTHTGNHAHPNSQTASDKEVVLNQILMWKLLPPELEKSPVPSLIYGPQHLLRLFVKLPDLLSKMKMSDQKQKALLKHLELFLEYLVNRHEEIFSDTIYVDK